jgi:hypothetical protein
MFTQSLVSATSIGTNTRLVGRIRRRPEPPRCGVWSLERLEALDEELARRASDAGRLRFEMGRGLDLLERNGGAHELGFSSIEAYALERCERSASWTQKARALARRLERLPALADALVSGSLSWSMAAVLATFAQPEDAHFWLAEAARRTVREMKALVLEGRGAVDEGEPLEVEEEMRTSIKAKRRLAKRLGELRFLADALASGELGYEAARLVAEVATSETVDAWVTRATERTLRHLREEIDAAELLARWSESTAVVPPSEADVRPVEDLERAVVTGQMSAMPVPTTPLTAPPANVTLRLRVRASTARDFRHWEAIYLRHRAPALRSTTFLRFACELFVDLWRPRPGDVAYAYIYERDRSRCQRFCLGFGA